jgi:thiazole synthase ThiGH ThiG subunit
MATPELFSEDIRAAVDKHELNYRGFGRARHRWNTLDLVEARRLKDLGINVKLPESARIGSQGAGRNLKKIYLFLHLHLNL